MRCGRTGRQINPTLRVELLAHPRYVVIDKALQKFLRAFVADVAVGIEHPFRVLEKHFRLRHHGDIQVGQHVAQVLLRQRGACSANRYADDRARLARKRACTLGA